MPVTVRIARTLQPYTAGEKLVACGGTNVAEVLACVAGKHPGFGSHVLTADGSLHRHLNAYVNDEDVRFLQGLATSVGDGDEVALLAAVSGG